VSGTDEKGVFFEFLQSRQLKYSGMTSVGAIIEKTIFYPP
jgi:hypothetical protein